VLRKREKQYIDVQFFEGGSVVIIPTFGYCQSYYIVIRNINTQNQPMKPSIISICLFLLVNFLFSGCSQSHPDFNSIPYGNNDEAGNFIDLNGTKIYFEVYGDGPPLVLIHGNGGNIACMEPQIEFFKKKYKVIIADCRGRGKSDLGIDSLTYIQMSKDINDILDYLKLDSAYVIGRSDGGIISLLMGIYYPEKVKKIAAFAANLSPDTSSLYPFFYNQVIKNRKLADEMIANKDKTQNWRVVQQQNRLMEYQPYITANDLHKIKCPVLVLSSDRDIIKVEHTLFIYRNISQASLCIFPGENHYLTKSNPNLFNKTVDKFFDETFRGDEWRQ